MKKNIPVKLILLMTLLVFIVGCATTSGVKETSLPQDGAVVTDIKIEDNKVVIMSSKEFSYTLFSANDPYKTTVDIPDMILGDFTYKIISNRKGVTELIPQQVDEPNKAARFDIVLESPSSIVPVYKDNTLTLMVKAKESAEMPEETVAVTDKTDNDAARESAPADEKTVSASETPRSSPAVMASEISSIALRKTAVAVEIVIKGNGTMIPNVFPLDERIVVDISDVRLNAALPESVIAPLRGIRAGKHREKVRLVLDLKEKTNFDVTAIGSSIIITLQGSEQIAEPGTGAPAAAQAAPAMSLAPAAEPEELVEGKYVGKRISLDFQDADIIPIFRLLADVSGYNIVVHPNVKGTTTLKLINVPWDQALDIILRTFSLSKLVDGNIIRIVPTSIVAQELDDISKRKKAESEAGELRTRIFPVNYADLNKLKDAIDKAKVLSSRGSITLDERGSSIIVNDIEPNLQKIDALIAEIDREQMQARQVMIEAKIVEVTSDYTKDLGIQWGAKYSINRASDSTTIGGTAQTEGAGFSGNNFLVNLPAAVAAGKGGALGFGYISKAANFALDVQLSALESQNKGKVLSNPKIMTMNNQEASITQGRTIYLPVATADKTDFKAIDALLSLKVKPRIAPGGAIFMDLDITKDEPGTATAGGVDVLKNTVKTSVLVNDADTVVIGGIFKTNKSKVAESVPGLSKIPLFGNLFKKNTDVESDTELLIFITPKIVEFSALK